MPEILDQKYEKRVELDKLKLHPENPRKGSAKAIALSIQHHGFYGAVVVQKSTGHILAGNHRYLSAKGEGLTHIPVIWLDVDDATARKILLADNRINDMAGYDDHALAQVLTRIQAEAGTVEGTGYDQAAFDAIVKSAGDHVLRASQPQAQSEGTVIGQAGDPSPDKPGDTPAEKQRAEASKTRCETCGRYWSKVKEQ